MLSPRWREQIFEDARSMQSQLTVWRRHLHAHPELSFVEFETQRYLASALDELGLTSVTIAQTGLLTLIENPGAAMNGGKQLCIALRADMDALPIEEVQNRSHRSVHQGIMHACGHDVHSTCALGAAALLVKMKHQLPLSVKILFQPGEELLPGGATKVIKELGLQHPEVAKIVALHVAPEIEVGSVGLRAGAYMASADEIYISLRGPGGHGALAYQSVDLIAAAAQMLVSLQQVVSRKAPAHIPTVLSFGKISSEGGATNVLPQRLDIAGTFRTYDEAWRHRAHQWIREIVSGSASMLGAEYDLDIRLGYPALSNDAECTQTLKTAFTSVFGPDRVLELGLRPTAEDFAWYLQRVPGCFFRLGVANTSKGITAGVHTPEFDVDEECLPIGAAAMAIAAIELGLSELERGGVEKN